MKSVLMILPNHSWTADSKEFTENHCKNRGGIVSAEFIPLDEVKVDPLWKPNWKRKFRKKSVYPPIVIDLRGNHLWLLDGNHRVTVWREWGCTYAPAWVIRKKDSQ